MKGLWVFGSYQIDFDRRLLLLGKDPIQLPPKALDTLLVLVEHRGEVVSKEALMQAVWPDAFVEEGNLTQNVHLLRKALGERVEEHRYVVTVPGRGYKFVASLKEISISTGGVSQDSQGNADFEFAPTTLKAGLAQAVAWLRSRLKNT